MFQYNENNPSTKKSSFKVFGKTISALSISYQIQPPRDFELKIPTTTHCIIMFVFVRN